MIVNKIDRKIFIIKAERASCGAIVLTTGFDMKKTQNFDFTRILLAWNKKKNEREMPWKGEKDPYRVWLSEVILQQTKVEQGLKYYQSFIKTFPSIEKLAEAPDRKIY